MRILAGKYKGRIIKTSTKNKALRPTLSILRRSIFDILQNMLEFDKSCFVDLFAGSGAVGLEAASRGFKKVFFVEKDHKIIKYLNKNTEKMPTNTYETIKNDCIEFLLKTPLAKNSILTYFDDPKNSQNLTKVVFLDPPYRFFDDKNLIKQLNKVSTKFTKSLLVVQKPLKIDVNITDAGHLLKTKKHGKTEIKIYKLP